MKTVIASLVQRVSPTSLVPVFLLSSLIAVSASAQSYPVFTGSGVKNTATLHRTSSTVGASPTLVTANNGIAVAYANTSGALEFAQISSGFTIGTPVNVGPVIGADNTPAAANLNGTIFLAYIVNGGLYTVYSVNQGLNWQGPFQITMSIVPTGRPSMAVINGSILLTFRSGNNVYYTTGNGTSFGTIYSIPAGYPAPVSNPSVSPSPNPGGAVIVWNDASGYPVSAVFSPGNLVSPLTVHEITAVQFGGDPAPVLIQGYLFFFGRSFYSADNLWAIQTDGYNASPQHEYGQTLTNSPSLIVDPNNGNLLTQLGRSNFGSNIWAYAGH